MILFREIKSVSQGNRDVLQKKVLFQMKTGLYGKKEGFFKRRKRYIIDSERCFKGRQGYIKEK